MALTHALPQVHIMLDHLDGQLEMVQEFYTASWPSICSMVNLHNDEFVAGNQPAIMRVFCPWEGEELYVPKL